MKMCSEGLAARSFGGLLKCCDSLARGKDAPGTQSRTFALGWRCRNASVGILEMWSRFELDS